MNFASATAKIGRLVSCVFVGGVVIAIVGCEKSAAPLVDQPGLDVHAQSTGADVARSQRETLPSVSQVEPGTELTEANFVKTLQATGAKFVVVQVYLENCGPCMTEALHLTDKEGEWRSAGVAILGMGMGEAADESQRFYEHTGQRVTYPLYFAPWFSEQQKVVTTPTVFIYSVDGEQLFRTDPEQAQDGVMASLDAELSRLLTVPEE